MKNTTTNATTNTTNATTNTTNNKTNEKEGNKTMNANKKNANTTNNTTNNVANSEFIKLFAGEIIANRNEKSPVKIVDEKGKKTNIFVSWENSVEILGNVAFEIVRKSWENTAPTKAEKTVFFNALKKCYAFFNDASTGEKFSCSESDFISIITIASKIAKDTKVNTDGMTNEEAEKFNTYNETRVKEVMPIFKRTFRKSFEIFVADRLTNRGVKTIDERKAFRDEAKAIKKARRDAIKAKAKAEKAKAETKAKA